MAKRKCPGCGAWFDGRRCPACLYELFDAEEVPTPHAGALYRPTSIPKPTSFPTPAPRPAYRTGGRKSSRDARGVKILVITMAVVFLSLIVGILIAAMSSVVEDFSVAEPEPVILPEDGLVLYQQEGVRVILDWDGGAITGDIPVYVENNSRRDIVACTAGVAVNGCMNDDVFFYCDAREGTVSMSQLWIEPDALQSLGIGEIREITLALEVFDEDTYDLLSGRELLSFGPGGEVSHPDSSGQLLWEDDSVKLVFQGVEQDEYGFLYFRFYAENLSGGMLDLSTSELLVNGEESEQYLYQNFFPYTSAVILLELYRASSLGIMQAEDVTSLEFTAGAVVDENWEEEVSCDISVIVD